MQSDRHTKFLLTAIAAGIWCLVLIQVGTPEVDAQTRMMNVNLAGIGGYELTATPSVATPTIPVDIQTVGGAVITPSVGVPVKISAVGDARIRPDGALYFGVPVENVGADAEATEPTTR